MHEDAEHAEKSLCREGTWRPPDQLLWRDWLFISEATCFHFAGQALTALHGTVSPSSGEHLNIARHASHGRCMVDM